MIKNSPYLQNVQDIENIINLYNSYCDDVRLQINDQESHMIIGQINNLFLTSDASRVPVEKRVITIANIFVLLILINGATHPKSLNVMPTIDKMMANNHDFKERMEETEQIAHIKLKLSSN